MLSQHNDELVIISANLNLMPCGVLSSFTTGNANQRALKMANLLIRRKPDVLAVQELYNPAASSIFIDQMERAGYRSWMGPTSTPRHRFNSGQIVFTRKNTKNAKDTKTMKVMQYQVLSFVEHGVYGLGPLEQYVPKGMIYLQLKTGQHAAPLNIFSLHLQSDILTFPWNLLKSCATCESYDLRWNAPRHKRLAQIALCKSWMQRHGISTTNSIYLGDLNLPYKINPKSEYQQVLKMLKAEPAINQEYVTVGSPNNTSHYPVCWWIGSKIWSMGQLDHMLLSHVTYPTKDFTAFELTDTQLGSLTDHAAIQLRLEPKSEL